MLQGKRIILGVTGGIAAYKAVFLLRDLQKLGADIRVTMTPAAQRFVGAETFSALSRHDVAIDVFTEGELGTSGEWTRHIEWGEWADLYVVAPCTANSLAKIVHGFSDNMLTSVALAARCPILLCPTMDGGMYRSAPTRQNLELAEQLGFHLLEPDSGYLASGLEDKGRLPENEVIIEKIKSLLSKEASSGALSGKHVVVTAGPTREFIDPVRFISNPSSGKMGVAMAEAAKQLGARVTLIHGPLQASLPGDVTSIAITTASEYFEAVKKQQNVDVFIMAAAVSDFAPSEQHDQKVKKEHADTSITLKSTPDTLQWLGDHKKEGQILIGFAMESENLLENARLKREKKHCDWIIANSVIDEGSGFAYDTNSVYLIGKSGETRIAGTKTDVALKILTSIFG